MPTATATATAILFLLSFTFRPLSSTSTLHHRRILHQPFLPQDSPPPTPSPPSPPNYPFSGTAPKNSPFFPFYPSPPPPPPPPSPASFATFPANISSLTVPHPSKTSSSSPKLIVAAVAAVIAAVAVVSLAVFLHLRSRTRSHGSSSFNQTKTQRSDNSSTVSFNQTPSTHHIPKLQRPSQTSSEFLYLGTMVNSHVAGSGAAFNGSTTNHSTAANSRKMESPELHPLPPLNTQQGFRQSFMSNGDVVSCKDDESEEFYSPKGSVNGRESLIGTGSTSRRAFAAIEVENSNGSTSNSSSTYSSSVRGSGSGSGSPVRSMSSSLSPTNNFSPRSSMPKSPDLIEIQTIVPPQMPSQQELKESASPSPPSSSSPERCSRRSAESSPRISNVSDHNVESRLRNSSSVQHNNTDIPTPTEIQGLAERYSGRSNESSPRNSNASNKNVESPVRISSPVQHSTTVMQTPSEIQDLVFPQSASLPPSSSSPRRSEESSPRISNASNQDAESTMRIGSSVEHKPTVIPTLTDIKGLEERYSGRNDESSPRNSSASYQNTNSQMRISISVEHKPTVIPTPTDIQGLEERYSGRIEESSPWILNATDQNVESPVRISSPVHDTTVIQKPPEIQGAVLPESELPLHDNLLSPERDLGRSEESSPWILNASDQNVESPVRISSPVQHNTTEIQGLVFRLFPSSLPLSSSPARYSRSEESLPRISNASDQRVESPERSSGPVQHNNTVIPTQPEMQNLEFHESAPAMPLSSMSPEKYLSRSEESSPRSSDVSGQNVESPVRINSPVQHNNIVIPTPAEMQNLVFDESELALPPGAMSLEKYSSRSEESSPRISNVSNQSVESPVGISSTVIPTPPEMQGSVLHESASPLPPGGMSPEKYLSRSEESSPRSSNVSNQGVESLVGISSIVIPTPPEMQGSVLHESASPLPPGAIFQEKCLSRSEESSPRSSNVSNQSVESPVGISSTVIPTPPEMQGSVLHESASPLPLGAIFPEKCLSRIEESLPRSSNVSDQHEESLVIISSSDQHDGNITPTPPEMQDLEFQESAQPLPPIALSAERYSSTIEESSPRNSNVSDQNIENPVRVTSPVQHTATVNPTSPEIESLLFLESVQPLPMSLSYLERYSGRIEESSPRLSNVSDQNVESNVKISSPIQHKTPSPMSSSSLLPERYSISEESSPRILNDSVQNEDDNASVIPPPPPPPPPSQVSIQPPPPPPLPPWSKALESPRTPTPLAKKPLCEPPALITPLRPIAVESPTLISPIELPSIDSQTVKDDRDSVSSNKETEYSSEEVERNEESPPKPKLKPLHWDKVRASSDREMVWDQLKCSSFKLNEEMIETLFVVNTPKPNPNETTRWQVLPSPGQDNGNRVLDPKKAQNIAILLRALHVTVDEVCEGLLEGNADILGAELLESLLKMAPTKEEERKLKEYNDDSPVKLGAAERFLKAVVDIPYAFKRVEAMLYVSNFESEVEYLIKSFATLEAACEELRTSRMFLKLLEAVLKTGNRMNVGTNRGDAHAFKLDTLLKLVDVKGADGKTTLLHFVVQEIIRTEGARLSGETPSTNDDAKCRKLGLQVVSALSSELSNVKKAAVMDAEVLSSEVSKLSKGIENIKEIFRLNETVTLDEHKFSESMNRFMKRAEEEIFRIQAQESVALTLVKEITEYFHGNSAKEEAHPFRIFMVVRDFLTILDRVCKEVGMINERTMVSSAHKFPVPVNPMLQQAFHKRQHTSSNDESFPLNV